MIEICPCCGATLMLDAGDQRPIIACPHCGHNIVVVHNTLERSIELFVEETTLESTSQ